MPGGHSFRSWGAVLVAGGFLFSGFVPGPQSASHMADPTASAASRTSLRICLRLADESSFGGPARVRLRSPDGREVTGTAGADGDFLFNDVMPRDYTVEAIAPGFAPVRQKIE